MTKARHTLSEPLKKAIQYLKTYDGPPVRIMEVCGTHTHEIFRQGIRQILSPNITLISGPGCPVCVTPGGYIDRAVALAEDRGATVCTFGDLMRVPGTDKSLSQARADGADVRIVYAPDDAEKIAADNPDRQVVFLAVGFETTTPSACLAVDHAIADGADSVQYFQWRRSRGGAEQFHGAVMDHSGSTDTRVFKDVAHTGEVLKKIAQIEGSVKKNEAAVIFEWDCWWSIDVSGGFSRNTKKYDITCMDHFKSLMPFGVEADVISVNDDFSDYKLIIAPMLFLIRPETIEKMKDYVANGGILLATYMTGYVNENSLCYEGGFPGNGLKDLFGIINDEIDTLYPSDRNGISMNGETLTVKDYAELLRLIDAEAIGTYTDDFYKDMPAITCKKYGKGKAYYQAARIVNEDMGKLVRLLLSDAGINTKDLPSGIEYHARFTDECTYEFYFNVGEAPAEVTGLKGTDILSGEEVNGSVTILPKRYIILRT